MPQRPCKVIGWNKIDRRVFLAFGAEFYGKKDEDSNLSCTFSFTESYRGLTGGFLLLQNFSVAISVSPHVCFILVLILISMFLRLCIYELEIFHANQTTKCLRNQGRTKGEGWSTEN